VALFEDAGYETVPSQANFILVRTPDAGGLADALASRGVSVRPGRALGVADAVRVSIPSRPGLALLKQAMTEIGEQTEAPSSQLGRRPPQYQKGQEVAG
jgi:histidinol-phosphate/aromatic aminotransferase/cobyric acid decarboxylase-like protein